MRFRKKQLALVLCATLGLAGCEWDNSDEWEQNQTSTEDGSGDQAPTDGGGDTGTGDTPTTEPPTTETPTNEITGKVASDTGYLSGATICADLNGNNACDEDEPTATSGEDGSYTLAVDPSETDYDLITEAVSGTTINESTGETVTEDFTLQGPYDPDRDSQFVSPLTDLVSKELDQMDPRDLDEAIERVASRLDTSGDILADYLAGVNSDDPLVAENSERLKRISETIEELEKQIENTISDTERANSGLTDEEIDQRIQDQIDQALPDLINDVNDSLASSDPYDPSVILNDPKYDDDKQQPSLSPETLAAMDLKERIAVAKPDTPYFYQSGYERKATSNGETISIKLFPHPQAPGKLYYEAVRAKTVSTDVDIATVESFLTVPRYDSSDTLSLFTAPDGGYWCEPKPDDWWSGCTTINLDPSSFTALLWSGRAFKSAELRKGLSADRVIAEGYEDGSVVTSSKDGGLSTTQFYEEFSLSGLDSASVVQTLLKEQLPPAAFEATTTSTFPTDATAWGFNEELGSEMIASSWPGGNSYGLCESPGLPTIAEVSSCNLVYGHTPMDYPATTIDNLTYPAGALGTAYTGSINANYATGAIRIDGPGSQPYVMRLFGRLSDGSGAIQIDRQTTGGTWEKVSTAGQWEQFDLPFPHIKLTLPDAYKFRKASGSFRAGTPILFERAGYVRYGWVTPTEVDLETLFGRKPIQFVVNAAGLQAIHDTLREMNLLETHPYFWEEKPTQTPTAGM